MAEKILVVDDDPGVRTLVNLLLSEEGLDVVEAATFDDAMVAVDRDEVFVAIVDLALGGRDGLDLVRRFAVDQSIAVMILSGKSDTLDRIIGLEVGADDYVTKPFANRELVARVKRQLSRIRQIRQVQPSVASPASESAHQIRIGRWIVDPDARSVRSDRGEVVELSESEFRTLLCLLQERGRVLTRDKLHKCITGAKERDPLDRRIDGYIASLRKKLASDGFNIRTVHRYGYVAD